MKFKIIISPLAKGMIHDIKERAIRETILHRIDSLIDEPEKMGKPMTDDLTGFRSIRAVGQRYRIIYKVVRLRVEVAIVAVGIRKSGDKKDIYALAKKMMRMGFLN